MNMNYVFGAIVILVVIALYIVTMRVNKTLDKVSKANITIAAISLVILMIHLFFKQS